MIITFGELLGAATVLLLIIVIIVWAIKEIQNGRTNKRRNIESPQKKKD